MSTILWCIAAYAAGQVTALLLVAFCMGCAEMRKRDEAQMAFLEKYGVSEKFLEETEEVPEDERPRARVSSQQELDKLEAFLAQWAKKDGGATNE